MDKMIGYCGIDCSRCDVYIATINNDDELRAKTAEKWSELNRVTITPDMLNCVGCRCDGVKTYFCSDMCEIRKCAEAREYVSCCSCGEAPTCKKLSMIITDNEEARKNVITE